jgi:hypothetical protein
MKESTYEAVREYLEQNEPEGIAFVAFEDDNFMPTIAGDDEDVDPIDLLGALIWLYSRKFELHLEDIANKGLASAIALDQNSESTFGEFSGQDE